MAALVTLTEEDHAMLSELPQPHGQLFGWLESQLHEHGPQPWMALREGLQGLEVEELAYRLMSGHELAPAGQEEESEQELRRLLNRMLVDQLKSKETEAIEAAKSDPSALSRYRELQARRCELECLATQVTPSN